ncbi:MAG TPA: glycoside hydrolase family 32 protein, partial [Verrucomicrobiae bacterium]|nr:glycoside hydrolase family 32 protein [Verrucomicrobiae bacterium]
FSHKRASQYLVGDYDKATHKFKPDYHGRMNYGPWVMGSLHAPSAFIDDRGRFLAIFNVRENKTDIEDIYKGKSPNEWYGIMTLPRYLWLDDHNALHMAPVREVESLRFEHQRVKPLTIPANKEIVQKKIHGKAMELDAVFQLGKAREFGLNVLRSPDGQERTTTTVYMNMYERGRRQLGIYISHASLRPDVKSRSPEIGPLNFSDNTAVRLRVFIDRSLVEVYANDTQCLTLRIYQEQADSRNLSVFARGHSAKLVSLNAWQMYSICPELKKFEG